jgi:hypothetical protein
VAIEARAGVPTVVRLLRVAIIFQLAIAAIVAISAVGRAANGGPELEAASNHVAYAYDGASIRPSRPVRLWTAQIHVYDTPTALARTNASRFVRLLATDATIGLGTEEGGLSSFSAAKNALGSPGEGNVYDHIVEQSQIGRSGFSSAQINNPENLNSVLSEVNQLKANYYSTKQLFSEPGTVRDWLSGQSFEDQWNFGMDVTEQILNGEIP